MSNESFSSIVDRNSMFALARFVPRGKFSLVVLFTSLSSVFQLRDAARKLLEKELDHLHSNVDAWHIFISKWTNLFNQLFKKDADGALNDADIRDIFLDDMSCERDGRESSSR